MDKTPSQPTTLSFFLFFYIKTNLAIAVAGVVDLFSRLFFGWLTDKPICRGRRGAILAFTWLVEAANAIAFGELAGIPWRKTSLAEAALINQQVI